MNYQVYLPHPLLTAYIKCYWSLEEDGPVLEGVKERVFPDGCMELIFHYGDLFRKHTADNSFEIQPRSFIHGQLKTFIQLEATGKTGVLGIRFTPFGLAAFSRHQLQEISGAQVTVKDFWGKKANGLEDRVLNAGTNEQRITLVESFLLDQLKQNTAVDRIAAQAVSAIIAAEGRITIKQLASNLNIGHRQLERRFMANVGLTPKLLSRITRFQYIQNLIERKQFPKLTSLAYDGGFYDQAHFIRDFRAFTGLSPKQHYAPDLRLVNLFGSW